MSQQNGIEKPVAQKNNEMNNQIYSRNLSAAPMQPYFSLRATPTKYTKLMTTLPAPSDNETIKTLPVHCPHNTFYPANRAAPYTGFSNKVDRESELRNQLFALQKCPQSAYVPSSGSDLYSLDMFSLPEQADHQSHPLLFKQEQFNTFDPRKIESSGRFNEHTRQEIKNVSLNFDEDED